ncbi:MAG: glycosyltransferase [Chitinophagaceae bacterium]|nr:glycosyltransferase [Chitinophagaceae bacterium]
MSSNSLTVLLPTYNAGPYIKEAVDSILAQTYTDFEFLIIDDGSTDETAEILKSYSDPRITVVSQQNKGLITTLNEGILASKGDIIARMDADDVCLPDRLALQMDFLDKNPDYVLVGAEADIMDKDGNYLMPLIPIAHAYEEIQAKIDEKVPFIHPCVTFRKDAVIKAGLYPKNALDFEDHLLWKKLLAVGKVCNLRDRVLKVRFNPESVTIDERWRGKVFIDIRRRSIHNGYVSNEDAATLKKMMAEQNFKEYRQASYYAMIAKKHLWNNPNSKLARKNLAESIKHYPKNMVSYLLYAFSYLPGGLRKYIYNLLKKPY